MSTQEKKQETIRASIEGDVTFQGGDIRIGNGWLDDWFARLSTTRVSVCTVKQS